MRYEFAEVVTLQLAAAALDFVDGTRACDPMLPTR